MLLTPLVYAGWLYLAHRAWGLTGTLVSAALLPVLGLLAIAFSDRWGRVREDLRLFRRALGSKDRRQAISELRTELVEEFDKVVVAMERSGDSLLEREGR